MSLNSKERMNEKLDRSLYLPEEYKDIFKRDREKYIEEKTKENIDIIKKESKKFDILATLNSLMINS